MQRLPGWLDEADLWFWTHLQELDAEPQVLSVESDSTDDVSSDGAGKTGWRRIMQWIGQPLVWMRRNEP